MLQNLRGLRKSSEIPRAKHVLSLIEGRAKGAKFGNLFFFSLQPSRSLRETIRFLPLRPLRFLRLIIRILNRIRAR